MAGQKLSLKQQSKIRLKKYFCSENAISNLRKTRETIFLSQISDDTFSCYPTL
jgi:hypothetical protein